MSFVATKEVAGQDLCLLKNWVESRPFVASYFGLPALSDVGIELQTVPSLNSTKGGLGNTFPTGLQPGWCALGVNQMIREPQARAVGFAIAYCARFHPVAYAGYASCIYHPTMADAQAIADGGGDRTDCRSIEPGILRTTRCARGLL
jgi:hypothetical protein